MGRHRNNILLFLKSLITVLLCIPSVVKAEKLVIPENTYTIEKEAFLGDTENLNTVIVDEEVDTDSLVGASLSKSEIKSELVNTLYGGQGGYISCDFDGYVNTSGRHEGIDITYKNGASVYAVCDGEITNVVYGSEGSGGLSTIAIYYSLADKTVIYLHTAPLSTLYTGQAIYKGQQIATQSWRGVSSANSGHTHVEVRSGRKTLASKSVNDYTLDNEDPYPFWETIFGSCTCSESYEGAYICTSNTSLIIRSGHGTSYSSLGSIPNGAEVLVSKANGNWAHVSYNGIYGYASMDYLEKKNTSKPEIVKIDSAVAAGYTAINISWTKLNDVNQYHIYRRANYGDNGYQLVASVDSSTSFYQDKGLAPGTSYSYKVHASNSAGSSVNPEAATTSTNVYSLSLSKENTIENGTYVVKLAGVNYALSVSGNSNDDEANVHLWACDLANKYENWDLYSVGNG